MLTVKIFIQIWIYPKIRQTSELAYEYRTNGMTREILVYLVHEALVAHSIVNVVCYLEWSVSQRRS